MTAPSILDVLEELITTVVGPAATDVEADGSFPRSAVRAPGEPCEPGEPGEAQGTLLR